MRTTLKLLGLADTDEDSNPRVTFKKLEERGPESENLMEPEWSSGDDDEDGDWDDECWYDDAGGSVSMMPRTEALESGGREDEEDYPDTREFRNPSHVNMQKDMIVEVLHSAIMRRSEDKNDPANPVIRNLEIGEKLEFLEGGNNGRIRVKTVYDGMEGWVTTQHSDSGVQILGVGEEEIQKRDTNMRNTRISSMFGGLGEVFSRKEDDGGRGSKKSADSRGSRSSKLLKMD